MRLGMENVPYPMLQNNLVGNDKDYLVALGTVWQ